jgi:hypothetical protein
MAGQGMAWRGAAKQARNLIMYEATEEQLEKGRRLLREYLGQVKGGPRYQFPVLTEDDCLWIGAYVAKHGYDGPSQFVATCRKHWIDHKVRMDKVESWTSTEGST